MTSSHSTVVHTLEQLKALVSSDSEVIVDRGRKTILPKKRQVSYIVRGGVVDMFDTTIDGMYIRFENCEIVTHASGNFIDCHLVFESCTLHPMNISSSIVTFDNNTLNAVSVGYGSEIHLFNDNKCEDCRFLPTELFGGELQVLEYHRTGNMLSAHCQVFSACVTVGSFGTYRGNVHYFRNEKAVIAGCWQGTLEEFKGHARERGVDTAAYEAVYNYLKLFEE